MSDGSLLPLRETPELIGAKTRRAIFIQNDVIAWNVVYFDQVVGNRIGFDDPVLGSARRMALEDALLQVSKDLEITGARDRVVDLQIDLSEFDPASGTLARAGSLFPNGRPGIFVGHTLSRIQTGIKADPRQGVPDARIGVNFGASYHLGDDPPPPQSFDFRTVIRHEILHALGFASHIGPNGDSTQPTNPRIYTTYDRLLRTADGRELVDSNANFVGLIGDVTGASGPLRLSGEEIDSSTCGRGIRAFSPSPFDPGSSLSHIDPAVGGQITMVPGVPPGISKRTFSFEDLAVLRELGFPRAIDPQTGLVFCSPISFPVRGTVQSAVYAPVIGNSKDLIILSTSVAGSHLTLYPELDRAQPFSLTLDGAYQNMSVGPFGLDEDPAIVLSSLDRESLLVLSRLTLPQSGSTLTLADFEYAHLSSGPQSNSRETYSVIDPIVAFGNLDNTGRTGIMTASNRLGLIPFLRDQNGRFDAFSPAEMAVEIGYPYFPLRDLDVYQHGGPTEIEAPFANGAIISAKIGGPVGLRRINSSSNHRVSRLNRKGNVAYAAVDPIGGSDYLMRLRLGATGAYQIEERWNQFSEIGDVHIDTRSGGARAFISTGSDNRIVTVANSSTSLATLTGSQIGGYADGTFSEAQFRNPTAICQKDGLLYVIDNGNSVIRALDIDSRTVTTIAGRRPGQVGNGSFAEDESPQADSFPFVFSNGKLVKDACAIDGETLYVLSNFDFEGIPGDINAIDLVSRYVSTIDYSRMGVPYFPSDLVSFQRALFLNAGRDDDRSVFRLGRPAPSGTQKFSSLVRLGDVNGDGLDDAVTIPAGLRRDLRIATVHLNEGGGAMRQLAPIQLDEVIENISLAEMDDTPGLDMVVFTGSGARLLIGQGDGRFVENASWRVSFPTQYRYGRLVDSFAAPPSLVLTDSAGQLRWYVTDPASGWSLTQEFLGPAGIADIPYSQQLQWFDVIAASGETPYDLLAFPTGGSEVLLFESRYP